MVSRNCLVLFTILAFNLPLTAAPSGQQLLKACEHAIANGYTGPEASMCEWYVTPCDCNAAQQEPIPRVCLPGDISSRKLARKVIDGLKSEPELTGKSATYAAAVILSRDYPCSD